MPTTTPMTTSVETFQTIFHHHHNLSPSSNIVADAVIIVVIATLCHAATYHEQCRTAPKTIFNIFSGEKSPGLVDQRGDETMPFQLQPY